MTTDGGAGYVAPAERIATFDNDGTLWVEQPMYTQLAFALDRVKALAPQHPEWKTTQPFKAVLEGDMPALAAGGEKAMVELVMATHAGMTTDEFDGDRHRVAGRSAASRASSGPTPSSSISRCSRCWPISGPTASRPTSSRAAASTSCGPGPSGSTASRRSRWWAPRSRPQFEMRDGTPVLMRLPAIDFVDDGPGKPVGIDRLIGRRPIAAFGNSDGDLEMLQWTTAGAGPRFALIVHHTDAEREWAYDRKSSIGQLDKALDAATQGGWTVVDMKADWKVIYPFEK